MRLIVYEPVHANAETFVTFWAARYRGYDDAFYYENIGQELTESRIVAWFEWKNGTPLSKAKRDSVLRNFVARRTEVQQLPADLSAADFLVRFSEGGAIWRIFWLHCCRPRFPIYDQHVHRAMRFIESGRIEEIPDGDAKKVETYIGYYIPFRRQFGGIDSRKVDKALWAFGKFLSENSFPLAPARA